MAGAWKAKAEQGDAKAQYHLGSSFHDGHQEMKQSMFMRVGFYPLLADTFAAAEYLNRLQFTIACALALLALILAVLPRRLRGVRWTGIGFALVSIFLVIELARINHPQWQPAVVLLAPVAFSLFALWLSWRTS